MPEAENDLIAEVQQRERRNRHYAAGVFVISLFLAITLFLFIATNFPKWLGWCVLGILLCACSWVWRPGIRSLSVSRVEAASLVDAALATKDRAVSLAELEKFPSDTHRVQREVVAKQLTALIPPGVTGAQITPYVVSHAERRAIVVAGLCVIALVAALLMRPRSPLDELIESIVEIEAAHPELPAEVHSALALLVEQASDPRAESSEIIQAISAAQNALTNASDRSSRPATKDRGAVQQSRGERQQQTESSEKQSQGAEQTQTQDAKAGDPKGGDSTGGEQQEPAQQEPAQQEPAQQEPAQQGATSQDQSSQDGGQSQDAGQSQQGEQGKQSEQGKKGEQGQQGQQGDEGQQGEQQGEQGQAGGSGGNGAGAGAQGEGEGDAGSQPGPQGQQGAGQTGAGQQGQGQQEQAGEGQNQDQESSQQEGQQGQAGGSDKGAGKESSGPSGESGDGSAGEGIEKLQNALNKAKDALEPSQQDSGDKNQQGESPDAKGQAQDAAQNSKSGAGQTSAAEKPANQRSTTEGEQEKDSKHDGKDAKSGKEGAGNQGVEKQGEEKEEREQQAAQGTPGDGSQDSTGAKSPRVDRNAKAREGGFDPNAPEGPGLGGREQFKEVQIEARDEDVDERFTGEDLNPEQGDTVAQPKTTLEDITLAKPKSVPHKGEQPIPLEYRDVLK